MEASTKFREPSILDEESMSFGRRNNDTGDDDLSDLLGSKKVMFTTLVPHLNSICYTDFWQCKRIISNTASDTSNR